MTEEQAAGLVEALVDIATQPEPSGRTAEERLRRHVTLVQWLAKEALATVGVVIP